MKLGHITHWYLSVVNGQWGAWNPWNGCSKTCGGGRQLYLRRCDNPPPGPTGKFCDGDFFMERRCNNQPCPGGSIGLAIIISTVTKNGLQWKICKALKYTIWSIVNCISLEKFAKNPNSAIYLTPDSDSYW